MEERKKNMYYIVAGVFFILLFLSLLATLLFSMKRTLYRFRNVGILGGMIALGIGIIALIIDITSHGADSNSKEDFLLFLERFPNSFAHIVVWLFIILCVLMAVSNFSLMKHEGMRVKNMVGTFSNAIFIIGTVVIYEISRFLMGITSPETIPGYVVRMLSMFVYCMLDYAECIMLGIIIMGWIAAKQKPKYDKDFIIIPGCSISKTGGLLPLLKGRTNRAIRYAWEQEIACGKKVCFIPSGGQGPDEIMSEGSAMGLYLLAHSVEEEEVFPEKKSINTYENFAFSKQIAYEKKPDSKIAFATTNYHMLRCGMLAWNLGIDAEGISSSTKWYFWPNGFAREVVAIINMTKKFHLISTGIIFAWCVLVTLV